MNADMTIGKPWDESLLGAFVQEKALLTIATNDAKNFSGHAILLDGDHLNLQRQGSCGSVDRVYVPYIGRIIDENKGVQHSRGI